MTAHGELSQRLDIREEDVAALAQLLRARTGLDYTGQQERVLVYSLRRRLRARQLRDAGAYLRLLERDAEEWQQFINTVTVTETRFFRQPALFDALVTELLPRLHRVRPAGAPLHIWSVATAHGQEAYTLAMAALESGVAGERPVCVLGTDINTAALDVARRGRYRPAEVATLPSGWQARYLVRNGDGTLSPHPTVRRIVRFKPFNLLDVLEGKAPLEGPDVVVCANVLIYFSQDVGRAVVAALAKLLPTDGVLLLDSAACHLARGVLNRERVYGCTVFIPRRVDSSGQGRAVQATTICWDRPLTSPPSRTHRTLSPLSVTGIDAARHRLFAWVQRPGREDNTPDAPSSHRSPHPARPADPA